MIELCESVIVLDMDDTLYLEADFAVSGFNALCSQFGDRFDGPKFVEDCTASLYCGERGNIFNLALEAQGLEAEPQLIAQLISAYRSHSPDIRLCDDSERFLVRTGNRQTGLVTDGPEVTQASKVRALNLSTRIDHIVLTDSLPQGFAKPHPRPFQEIEQLSGAPSSSHVYIADNGAKDFLAPNTLGWRTVQILREGRIHDGVPTTPDHRAQSSIVSLDEISFTT